MKESSNHPETACMAFFSQAGIACASDTDGTIRLLSKTRPFAAALDPHSPIPWETICEEYLREQKNLPAGSLKQYFDDFTDFILKKNYRCDKKEKDHISEFVFMGFGENDLYPSLLYGFSSVGDDGCPEFFVKEEISVKNEMMSSYFFGIGTFDTLLPILQGVSDEMNEKFRECQNELFSGFQALVRKDVSDKPGGKAILKALDNLDLEGSADISREYASNIFRHDVAVGIDSFGIEEMVDSVETLVDAQIRLNSLRRGETCSTGYTREIAVMTIPEGLTWIKHPVYAI